MKELIEKLKNKNYVRAFGLMSVEEQECFKKARKQKNCLRFDGNIWADGIGYGPDFVRTITYAIKPDYQPESEFVDVEIKEYNQTGTGLRGKTKWLGVYDRDCSFEMPHFFTHLHCLPSLPNFEGFYLKGDVEVRPEWVARYHPKVIARFRT